MKKQLYFLLSVVVIIFLAVIANNWIESNKEEQRLIRQEQERMVKYTLENFEDIRKIEFTSFEQNFSTKSWTAYIIVNDSIHLKYRVDSIDKNSDIAIAHYIEESGGKKMERKKDKNKNINSSNVEIKYLKG